MNKKEELKELLFDMMKVEINKMDVLNNHSLNASYYGEQKAKVATQYNIMVFDEEGYSLGLRFQKLKKELCDNGEFKLQDFSKYPNATEIAAINLLGKYHLEYPPYWTLGNGGTEYFPMEVIEENHTIFIAKIEDMVKKGLISEFEKRRLIKASEFLLGLIKINILDKEQKVTR
jgi:hypothetical protein